jgi:hypothetical protein
LISVRGYQIRLESGRHRYIRRKSDLILTGIVNGAGFLLSNHLCLIFKNFPYFYKIFKFGVSFNSYNMNTITKDDFLTMVCLQHLEVLTHAQLAKNTEVLKGYLEKAATDELSDLEKADANLLIEEFAGYDCWQVLRNDFSKAVVYTRREQIAWDGAERGEFGEILKARGGVYKLTGENKKLGRVGQKYGSDGGKEDERKSDREAIKEHMKQSGFESLRGEKEEDKHPGGGGTHRRREDDGDEFDPEKVGKMKELEKKEGNKKPTKKDIRFIMAELTNDENSSDEEMINHFVKEIGMSKEEAKKWVDKRDEFLNAFNDMMSDMISKKKTEGLRKGQVVIVK